MGREEREGQDPLTCDRVNDMLLPGTNRSGVSLIDQDEVASLTELNTKKTKGQKCAVFWNLKRARDE